MQTITGAERRTRVGDHLIFSRESVTQAPPGSPCVVLVHGYIVSSLYMVPMMQELAPRCCVYAPDLPGWGRSSKPADALGVAELADVLAAWAGGRGLNRPIFLANSFGCQIVVALAARHPDMASGIILLGPTVDPRARSAVRQGARLALDAPHERLSLWLIEIWDLLRMGVPRAWKTLRIMLDDHIEDVLPCIAVPTLVVRGDRDPIAPERWAEEAARLAPEGRLVVLPGIAHCANYSAAACLTEAVLPFIYAQG